MIHISLLQMDQPPSPHTSCSASTQPLSLPTESDAQSAVIELAARAQQVEDLESEMSALRKKLIQQTEKYDHDMAMITQVCRLVPGLCLVRP